MRTLTRYIGRDVLFATMLLFVALIGLFTFFVRRPDRADSWLADVAERIEAAGPMIFTLACGFGGLYLRLCGLLRLDGLIVIGTRRPALLQEGVLAFELIACLRKLALGGCETGSGGAERIEFVLRVQASQQLASLYPVAELDVVFDQSPRDAKRESDFIFRFDATCERDRLAGLSLLGHDRADRPAFRCDRLSLPLTRSQH